jgi:hypothetical protein
MTPNEKAIELIRKFNTNDNFDFLGGVRRAKQCAIIAVDEILKEIDNTTLSLVQTEYWQEVKQEIEKA